MSGFCDGQVVVVTGGGRGIGRGHAMTFARHGAKVVVNDLGTTYEGAGTSSSPGDDVVTEIRAAGGQAVANGDDITDPDGAKRIIETAIDAFGDLHTVVNNAGILRSRTIFDMTLADMQAVMAVHLMGPFLLTQQAAIYWREQHEAGKDLNASVINTSSAAGLYPSPTSRPGLRPKLVAYASAKAAVAAFTMAAAMDLSDIGARVNAISPGGRTRMNTDAIADLLGQPLPEEPPLPPGAFDVRDPANNSPLVVWLSSPEAADITGRVFETGGSRIGVANGWQHGPMELREDRPFDPSELGPIVRRLLAEAPRPATMASN